MTDDPATRRPAKEQYLAIGYLCNAKDFWTERVKELHRQMTALYAEVGRRHPDLVRHAEVAWGKRRPCVTIGSYLWCAKERRQLDLMIAAAEGVRDPDTHVPGVPENDGLVVEVSARTAAAMDAALRSATDRPLTVKPYPQTMPALLREAALKYPEEDWEAKSEYEWSRVRRAHFNCTEAVKA
eukprot:10658853-Alexandrium_andersonii.AAC.1